MRATIHLLPWSPGIHVRSIDSAVPDGLSVEACASLLFEASNLGDTTAPGRSMSVGDVVEVYTPAGRVILGCCDFGWVKLPINLLPDFASMSRFLRGKVFTGMHARTAAA